MPPLTQKKGAGNGGPKAAPLKAALGSQPGGPRSKEQSLGDLILEPFTGCLDFLGKRIAPYYTTLVKIAFVQGLAVFAIGAVFAVIAILLLGILGGFSLLGISQGLGIAMASLPLLVAGCVLLLILVVLISWIETTIEMTAINYTAMELEGKAGFGIIETAKRIMGRTFRYVLVNLGIVLVAMLPAALIVGAMIALGNPIAGFVGVFLIIGYMVVVFVAFAFFAQFWRYGFLIDDLPVVEALKRSFKIAKARPLEVVLFDLLFIGIGIIVMIPLFIASMVVGFGLGLVQMIFSLLSIGILTIVMAVIITIVRMVANLLIFTLAQVYYTPTHYLFWKRIKERI